MKNFILEFDNGVGVYTETNSNGDRFLQIVDDECIDITDWDDSDIMYFLSIVAKLTEPEVHMACAYSMGDEVDWLYAFEDVANGKVYATGCPTWTDLAEGLIFAYNPDMMGCVDTCQYGKRLKDARVVCKNGKKFWGHYFYDSGTHMVYGYTDKEFKEEN